MSNGIVVYFVDLESKDPSELGFESITDVLKNTEVLTQEKLMEQRILCAL